MPIRIKTDLEWGDIFYLKTDPGQLEYKLVKVSVTPGNAVIFELSHNGEIVEVYDFEASKERDIQKALDFNEGEGEED